MNARMRKLVGTVAILVFLFVYIWAAAAIGSGRMAEAHGLFQVVYFLIAGLLWVVPAGLLIRWMQRPN